MKLFKIALVALVFLVNLAIAQPSLADRPKLTLSPDYTEVTQSLDSLLKAKDAPDQSDYTPEEIQQKLGELQLQKYILETAADWGQCRNETGKTLAVYAHKPNKSNFSEASTLYYLGNGKVTDDDWNCDGVYLPSGVKVAGLTPGDTQGQDLGEPVALKIVPGTQLVAKTNPETGAVEFNVPAAKVFKAGEGTWSIPNLSSTDVEAQTPNAPIED
ncbi:hypothetical protein NDI44_14975 [Trichocoleus sp. DQ-A3]|uniref:hypothetical protein n=1 Tax=Cyanophyceae TaxID=3028117 RepID=UPI00168988EA|nr:hypothetical protein [Coleofasciculus sp. FACHB-125]MBD1900658.1 hypothetical protein [Coleofasciculus sp. FACHB-125]